MLEFYRNKPAANCPYDSDGDMILYQWGSFDREEGETFQFDLTRQFTEAGVEDDDGISQLSLTLHYAPSDSLRSLESGNHWCGNPSEVAEFEMIVKDSQPFVALQLAKPERVELSWGNV